MTTDDGTDGWKGRPNTTASGQNQGYYINRLVGTCDLRTLSEWGRGGQAKKDKIIKYIWLVLSV